GKVCRGNPLRLPSLAVALALGEVFMNDFLGLITADWLTISLSEGGHLPTGAVEAIGFGRSFDAYASLLIRLELTYTSAAPRSAPKSLIYKAYGPDLYDGGSGIGAHDLA
ncbi:MAG: hypothetical protein ACPGWR_22825, partial [Ardenticatenaceae bacterium]